MAEDIRNVFNKSATTDQAVIGLLELGGCPYDVIQTEIHFWPELVLKQLSNLQKAIKDRAILFSISKIDEFIFDVDPKKSREEKSQILFLISKFPGSYLDGIVRQLSIGRYSDYMLSRKGCYYHFRTERKRLQNIEPSKQTINDMLGDFADPGLQLNDDNSIPMNDANQSGTILSGTQLSFNYNLIMFQL